MNKHVYISSKQKIVIASRRRSNLTRSIILNTVKNLKKLLRHGVYPESFDGVYTECIECAQSLS